jgi:hypothetical protein
MKLCSPKNILVALIILFLIFNAVFLFKYLLNLDQKANNDKISKDTKANFLKSIVNFNFTSFISQGVVHFFYPANKKVKFLYEEGYNSDGKNDKIKAFLNQTNINENFSKCDYFYDQDEKTFVDSNNKICDSNYFNFNNNCCKDNLSNNISFYNITYIYSKDCDNTTKCCNKQYLCISYCLSNRKSNLDKDNLIYFKECKNYCKPNLITKYFKKPFCSFTKNDLNENLISLVYSK